MSFLPSIVLVLLTTFLFACQSHAQDTDTNAAYAPLYLSINGPGTVTPFQSGQLLEVGGNYSLTAIPDSGYTFSGWQRGNVFTFTEIMMDGSGSLSTNVSSVWSLIPSYIGQPTLEFSMQSDVIIYNVPGIRTITRSVGWQANFGTNTDPVIDTQPVSQTVDLGATVTFQVDAIGAQPMSYQWEKNGTNLFDGGSIFGSTNDTLVITNVTGADAANYSVMVTNSYGSIISSNASLAITFPEGFNQIVCQLLEGGELQFSFVGLAGTNYVLERSFSLSPYNWSPLMTNPADPLGEVEFTDTPNPATNNFWRIRSVP